jgi:hypothetical protein
LRAQRSNSIRLRKSGVITALVAVIHVFLLSLDVSKDVNGRVKPGHDEGKAGLLRRLRSSQ